MNPQDFKITNGVVRDIKIGYDRGFILTVWLYIDHEDGGTQGFGGFSLGGEPNTGVGRHADQPNLCAEFLVGVIRACGLEEDGHIGKVVGKAVRVARAIDGGWNTDILGIGHIIKNDRWFHAKERMTALLEARKAGGAV